MATAVEKLRPNLQWIVLGLVTAFGLVLLLTPDVSDSRVGSAIDAPIAADIEAEVRGRPLASPHAAVVAAVSTGVEELLAHSSPDTDAPVVETFAIELDESAHFLATAGYRELQTDWNRLSGDGRWLEVHLPIRPNGSTGWIRLADVELYQNRFSIRVAREDFLLQVFDDGELLMETEVAIGTGDTPTPVGTFFTEELIRVPEPDGPYGPYAFVLSGHSEHLFSFNGGPGLIGIHGTNEPASLGNEVSHGCIRVDNDVIAELAKFIPLATPIEIV